MTRVFTAGNYSVYVFDERGGRHNSPHAHIKQRGKQVCSVHLTSLESLQPRKEVPRGLLAGLEAHQDEMIETWERLNGDD
jgi:Domain of unknown function (DUF4160)